MYAYNHICIYLCVCVKANCKPIVAIKVQKSKVLVCHNLQLHRQLNGTLFDKFNSKTRHP